MRSKVFQVRAPDGQILNIRGPEDATDDELASVAAANWKAGRTGTEKGRATLAQAKPRTYDPTPLPEPAANGEADQMAAMVNQGVDASQQGAMPAPRSAPTLASAELPADAAGMLNMGVDAGAPMTAPGGSVLDRPTDPLAQGFRAASQQQRALTDRAATAKNDRFLTAQASEPRATKASRAGDAVEALTGNERAGDLAERGVDTLLLIPEGVATGGKIAADIANLATLGAVEPVSEWFGSLVKIAVDQKSDRYRTKRAELAGLLQNDDAGVADVLGFLASNPTFTAELGIPSLPSMLVGAGTARLGATANAALTARRGANAAGIQGAANTGAMAGAAAGNVLMNAGATFSDTEGDLAQKLAAATGAAAGTALAGRIPGAEALIGRGARGSVVGTALREGTQEGAESFSQSLGQGAAQGDFDLGEATKNATVEGSIGGLLGGGAGALSQFYTPTEAKLPTQARAESVKRFDELAAAFGLNPKAAARVREQAGAMPTDEVPGFLARATEALNKRNFFRRPVDKQGVQELAGVMAPPALEQAEAAPAMPADVQGPPGEAESFGAEDLLATPPAKPAATEAPDVAEPELDRATGLAAGAGDAGAPAVVGGELAPRSLPLAGAGVQPAAAGAVPGSGEAGLAGDGGGADAALNALRSLAEQFSADARPTSPTFAAVLRSYADDVQAGKLSAEQVAPQIQRYAEILARPTSAETPAEVNTSSERAQETPKTEQVAQPDAAVTPAPAEAQASEAAAPAAAAGAAEPAAGVPGAGKPAAAEAGGVKRKGVAYAVYQATERPGYDSQEALSLDDADFEIEALQAQQERGRLRPESIANSEFGKRLDTQAIQALNDDMRADPAGTLQALRDSIAAKRAKANGAPAAGVEADGLTPAPAKDVMPAGQAGEVAAPSKDTRATADSTSERERDLRKLSRDVEQPGDVMLGNGKFITLAQAKAAAQEAIESGELRPDAPFQYNRVLDIAPRDWNRMVKEMTGEAYRDPTRGGRAQEPAPAAEQSPAPAEQSPPAGYEAITHTTGKGKTLRGVVVKGIKGEDALKLDGATFKLQGGYFVREKHWSRLPPVVVGNDRGESSPVGEKTTAPTEASSLPKVYRTRTAAEAAKAGNTQRLKRVQGGFILRQATDKEMAAAERAGRRLASGGGIDVENDSLLTAIAKLGGLAMSERNDTIGEGNKNVGGKMLFRQDGKPLDELARNALREFGYVPLDEVRSDGGVRWLRAAIKEEFGGFRQHWSEQGTEAIMERERAAEAAAFDGLTDDELADFSREELDRSGYTRATPEMQAATEALLAEAQQAGIDTEAIREDAARLTEGQSADEYETAVQAATRQALAQNRSAAARPDPGATGRGGEDNRQAAGDAGQEAGGQAGLTLTAQTEGDLRAKAEREEAATKAAAAKKTDEQERLRREAEQRDLKARADATVGDFQLGQDASVQMSGMGDMFADTPATPSAAEKSEPAKIEDVGEKIGGARKDMAVSTGTTRKKTDDSRPAWARRFQVSQAVTGIDENGENTGPWIIRDLKNTDWMGQPKQVGRGTYATKAEAEAFVPIAAVGLKHRPVPTGGGKYEIWREITDRKRVKVVGQQFDTRDEAMAYMLANAVQIIETNTTFGEADMPLPPDRQRTGPARREGNVKGEDFKGTFGLRAVEFGNWNNQDERQSLMNDAWDGLMDLADVLGIPPKAIGLNGDLALAFGARGHGLQSARAHYELDRAVINLTKEKGAGSLAHEWFHALDHYFGRQDGKASAAWKINEDGTRSLAVAGDGADMVSSGFTRNKSAVRPEVREAYERVLTTMTKKAEAYVEDTAKADKFTGAAREDLARELDLLRKDLAEQKDPRYWKRNNAPASAEVLAEFDTIAKAMLDGDMPTITTDWRIVKGPKDKAAARWTNDSLERLGELYKQVRGRGGFNAEKTGVADRLRGYMDRYSQRLKQLADAQSGAEKVKMVPTSFAMDARELDQGRGSDYWTTPHEMAARAFQGYVEDKIAERGGTSRFLNYGPERVGILTPWGFKRPFPVGEERKAINAALDRFVGVLQTREDDAGNVALFSRRTMGEPTPAMRALEESDELFALPRLNGETVSEIAFDLDPTIKVTALPKDKGRERWRVTLPNGAYGDISIRQPNRFGPNVYGFDINDEGESVNLVTERPGVNPEYVDPRTEDVWIDVSQMKTGQGGAQVYAIAGALAHNTGRMFIGDPNGLSKTALRRRAENMLSLALRYGTTDFLAPHPDQIKGDAANGVPALRWVYGDDEGNAERLIALNLQAVQNAFPDLAKLDFDATTGEFLNAVSGARIDRDRLARRALERREEEPNDGPLGRAAASRRTVARAVVLKALSRQEGGRDQGIWRGRNGVLDRLGAAASGAARDSLKGLFSRDGGAGGVSVKAAEAAKAELRRAMPYAPQINILESVEQAPRELLAAIRRAGAMETVEGAFHEGEVYIFPGNIESLDKLHFVMAHHELRHAGLSSLFPTKKRLARVLMAVYNTNANVKKAADAKMADGLATEEVTAVNEALADMPVAEVAKLTNVQRLLAAIRNVLRELSEVFYKMGWVRVADAIEPKTWTDADVLALVKRAEDVSRTGGPLFRVGGTAFSRRADGAGTPEAQAADQKSAGRPAHAQRDAGWVMPEGGRFDDFVYKFQDKNIDLKRAVAAVKAEKQALDERWDAYLAEELFHGRAAKRTQDFVANELEPLLRDMTLKMVKLPELEKYLHARHAREANELIAERNKLPNDGQMDVNGKVIVSPLQDGGSGMLTADAEAYLSGLEPAVKQRLEALAKRVDAMIAKTRQTYVDYGLESKGTVDGWAKLFQHYVPLQREDKDGGMGMGQGFSIKGRESKGRTGSTAAVVDILANIALQRERAIVRGEKNRVAVSVAGLVKTNPNPDLWSFDLVPTERVLNPDTNQVEERPSFNFKNQPNVLVAKIRDKDGEIHERAVIFNEGNERAMRMAAALKNLDAAQLEGVMGVMAKATRYFAAINTQLNPIFGAVNLVRDVQGAALNLGSTALKDKKAAVVANIPSALRTIYRTERGKSAKNAEMAKLWQDLQREGGMTGFRDQFRTSQERADAIRFAMDPTNWTESTLGKFFTAGGTLKLPLIAGQKVLTPVLNWLSDYNQAMEGATRLAAYKVALEQGLTKPRAASIAKNLTVNFNRKGQVGMQAGALYAFFNASVQGTARMGDVLIDTKGGQGFGLKSAAYKIIGGGILLGSMQAMLLAAAGFDDDEPPEFVRQRNLIIPTGWATGSKDYIAIPMPLGWHVFPNIGRISTEFVLDGMQDAGKRVVSLGFLTIEAFNPIGSAASFAQFLSPTVFDPVVALAENKDWTGKPIARESMNRNQPGFQLTRDTASSPAKWIAEGLNYMTGGTKYTRGALSPTPDQIDYLFGQVTGGVGREAVKAQQTIASVWSGENPPPHKVPLVGRFYGNAESPSAQASRFYDNLNLLGQHKAMLDGIRSEILKSRDESLDAELRSQREAYRAEHPETQLLTRAERVEKKVRDLRKKKREAVQQGAPRAEIKALEDRMTEAMTTFNDQFKSVEKPKPVRDALNLTQPADQKSTSPAAKEASPELLPAQ